MSVDHAGARPAQQAGPSSSGPRRADEYDHLTPLLDRFAALTGDDPARARLREALVRGFYPVVSHIASRYRGRGEPIEDVEQAGALGLLRAIDRFSPEHGSNFLAFAIPTITGEIRRHFRDRTWALHVPRGMKELQARMTAAEHALTATLGRAPRVSELAAHLGVTREEVVDALAAQESYTARSLDFPIAGSSATVGDLVAEPGNRMDVVDAWESVRPAIDALPERERTILMLRFHGNMTQSQIGERLGLSQMHVSRLLTRTLAGLRRHLTDDSDHGPVPAPVG